ncbi:glycosyltransferase family 4 protein [Qipengyuania thermophila]|uniref:glycosyltransferase family 4 protein n=1 Tax=Qipengyuania thermophila TaxID=2509361 RepID=UPI0013ECBFA6|nr:glycosyltransferase family 4 protein [Qipengyuania thermophila]
MKNLTIFFPAGDFFEALRRHSAGDSQLYATHNEVSQLLLDLEKADVKVDVFSMAGSEPYDRRWSDHIRVVQLVGDSVDSPQTNAVFSRQDNDGIIVHYPNRSLLQKAARSKARVLAVLGTTYNGKSLRAKIGAWRIARALNHSGIELVSNHCFPSTYGLADLGVKKNKLIAWDVPHAFTPDQFSTKTLGQHEPKRLAYAGSIAESKGVGDLLEAVAVMSNGGRSVVLDVAGGGAALSDMKDRTARLGIDKKVNFHGLISNDRVVEYFRKADVVILPSRDGYSEAFPLTLFEAVASRTPIVCSSHPTFRAVLRDGVDACIFRSEDPVDCARVIGRVLDDPELYSRLSDAADRSWIRFKGPVDWRTMVKTWIFDGPHAPWLEQNKLHHFPDLQERLAKLESAT